MEIFLLVLILAFLAAFFACDRVVACGRRPNVWLAVGLAFGISFVCWFTLAVISDWDLIFTWNYWTHIGKFGGMGFVAAVIGLSTAACLVPTTLVTIYFEKKWKRRHEAKS